MGRQHGTRKGRRSALSPEVRPILGLQERGKETPSASKQNVITCTGKSLLATKGSALIRISNAKWKKVALGGKGKKKKEFPETEKECVSVLYACTRGENVGGVG